MEAKARTYRIPMLMSVMMNGLTVTPYSSISMLGPYGTTAMPMKAGMSEMMGAIEKSSQFAPDGIMSSLKNSLMPSAIGWRMPYGPTSIGPMRSCIQLSTFRSARVSTATV